MNWSFLKREVVRYFDPAIKKVTKTDFDTNKVLKHCLIYGTCFQVEFGKVWRSRLEEP